MICTAIWTVIGLAIGVQAQPQGITTTAVSGCSSLPGFNNETNIAGPWTIKIDECNSATATGAACSIEGYAATCDVKRSAGETGIEKGIITVADSPQTAPTMFRCNGALQTYEALVPSGAGALDWHAVGLERDSSTNEMEWGLSAKDSEPLQAYRQYERGTPVSGLFLGSQGRTGWVVRHSGSGLSTPDRQPFWFLHLRTQSTIRGTGEYEVQIRIEGS
ncbi:hypothetical protein N7462_000847 [Penicillium macrosclerotiorum]|uniref:uncharacterized protein n=1 Tax=Penicillium macrosclerotiorum TaxID=303699 RepID=UPI002546E012|nr:uncharacterized protein N7462_000847 [Penicillium macrosclerotiorum]KAJ5698842.1 hypothetical protein N7462_000847 [Penicillium macrosclerotiorum]